MSTPRRLSPSVGPVAASFGVFGLAGLGFLPRAAENATIQWTLWITAALLGVGLLLAARRRPLIAEVVVRTPHWVQIFTQGSIYLYWGLYVDLVVRHVPLLVAQIVFAYLLDLLFSWWRRSRWQIGFGPVPIIGSTNLFLWFKDDWFYLQIVMIAVAFGAREVCRWRREGREIHIFNPSGIGLTVMSLAVLLTNSTTITWGEEIATTLNIPPYMFELLFVAGAVVQLLFHTTLVTASAALSLWAFGAVYHAVTGYWLFVDTTIPVAVFLGMNLLITDPATSPDGRAGKALFGAAYGLAVVPLWFGLPAVGQPAYFDKLLQVPVLNLLVPLFERAGRVVERWLPKRPLSPRQINLAWFACWTVGFAMMRPGLVAHPGADPAHWRAGCQAGDGRACEGLRFSLAGGCGRRRAETCFELAGIVGDKLSVAYDPAEARVLYDKGCALGHGPSCAALEPTVAAIAPDRAPTLERACTQGDGAACHALGTMLRTGQTGLPDLVGAADVLQKGCDAGSAAACADLGLMRLRGDGGPADPAAGARLHTRACDLGLALACGRLAILHLRGEGVERNHELAARYFAQACAGGDVGACMQVQRAQQPSKQ